MANKSGWEESDFPILCQTCLGDNPYLRMSKETFGDECKICERPFTIFRWLPGQGMRMKKTEICQTCAKLKNVCQTCILDLEFNLPVQVRDTLAGYKDDLPTSDINKQYYVADAERQMENGEMPTQAAGGKMDSSAKEALKKMSRTKPYFDRNRAHLCTFYAKGACTRGDECPYRHELPKQQDLAHQNLKDRYYGVNDPVAQKMLNQTDKPTKVKAPEDKSITSLIVQNLTDEISEHDLRNVFYTFGDIQTIVLVKKANLAFVNYVTREAAEQAIGALYNNLSIKGHVLRVAWGKPKTSKDKEKDTTPSSSTEKVSETAKGKKKIGKMPLPPGAETVEYPAQSTHALGHVPKKNSQKD